jgi:hypothetical protein
VNSGTRKHYPSREAMGYSGMGQPAVICGKIKHYPSMEAMGMFWNVITSVIGGKRRGHGDVVECENQL